MCKTGHLSLNWVHVQPRGDSRSIADRGGGSDIFLWVENLHPQYCFGPRDLSHIFLGLKVCLIE